MAIRVLIADDSAFAREVLRAALSNYPDIEIVGEASDGNRAERMAIELAPDVITMDVIMPMVGGLDAIKSIMARAPTAIIVVSDIDSDPARLAMQAMECGAIDTFAKPRDGFTQETSDRLAHLIRNAAQATVVRRPTTQRPRQSGSRGLSQRLRQIEFVGIVSSTGGPQTLRRLLSVVAKAPIHPIAVVQHTAVGHTKPLASWLAGVSGLRIAVVDDGDRIEPGMIAIAPDDYHLEVRPGAIARLHHGPKVHSHRPSGTVLLRSLASSFGGHAAGVILTGMGDDGAAGAEALEKRGGLILIEEPDDAILEGMPRAAMNCTSEAIVAAPEEIGRMLLCPSGRGDE